MEGGKSANYWPGFVDALTNVVIAMVFVIVVLAIALSFAAQMMGKRLSDELVAAKAAVSAAAASGAVAPTPRPAESSAPPTTLPTDTTIQVSGRAPAAAASSSVRAGERSLRLEFAETALALDPEAQRRLHVALAPRHASAATTRVQILATGPQMSLSDNQRSAYIRVLAVRNELIDEGFAVEHIGVHIETVAASARPTVTVSFPPANTLSALP